MQWGCGPWLVSALALFLALIPAERAWSQAALATPENIVTHNVPPLPVALATRLQRYAEARGARLQGWQGDALLITTRFAQTEQLHRVEQPLGYRRQLTYLPEPVAGVAVPRQGARQQVVLSWDVGGSEFKQLFLFNLENGESRLLSDGKSLYDGVIWAADEQSFVYVTTQRNGRNWDIHRQYLDGRVEVLLETESGLWFPVDWSQDRRRLLIRHYVSINESSLHELDIASGALRPLLGVDTKISVDHAQYDNRGGVYFTADDRSEFLQLQRLDLSSGAQTDVSGSLSWDVEGFSLSADYATLAFIVNEDGISRLQLLDVSTGKVSSVPGLPQGIILDLSFNGAGTQLAISVNGATSPSDIYVLDLADLSLQRWTHSEVGGLDTRRFAAAELIRYPTFDGRDIPAFLYQPAGAGPHPLVVWIHGGPEAQYRPYFSTFVQALVNELGVAVIAPNVRGSSGYGKTFLQLDNGRLREDSVRDIGALLDWVAQQPQLRADRVAVMGGSYGGYMVLASMVHYGDRLQAAVESVGISNFVTFLENTQAYRQDLRRVEYGDERDPQMRRFLQSISPLTHVDKMVTPLLISQGANDPRVPASESEQMRQALEKAGIPVWYILAQDEGHGFRKKINRDFDRVAKFAFLKAYLTSADPE
ncbi:MAG: S9 family peptidase [Pseudomonadota bacterium]